MYGRKQHKVGTKVTPNATSIDRGYGNEGVVYTVVASLHSGGETVVGDIYAFEDLWDIANIVYLGGE